LKGIYQAENLEQKVFGKGVRGKNLSSERFAPDKPPQSFSIRPTVRCGMIVILLIVLIILIVLAVITVIDSLYSFKVRREDLGGDLKIVQISDLHKRHIGDENCRLVDMIREENPDIIFVTGDLVTRDCYDFTEAERLLKKLNEIAHVYLIFGNHEQSLPAEYHEELIQRVKKTNTYYLDNNTSKIVVNDKELFICGFTPKYTTYRKDGYRNLDTVNKQDIINVLGDKPDGRTLLLAHNPLFAEAYSQWGADMTFSGHVHGGAVRIFGKGVLSPERKFFPKYTKGVYTVGNMKLLVTSGIGKLRLFNPAEMVVYKI